MNTERPLPQKQNLYKTMWYLIFSAERFVTIAAENSMAFELEHEEYKRKLAERNYSIDPKVHVHSHPQRLKDLRTLLLKTTGCILSVIILIVGIGFYTEVVY
ncbi:TPA: hypothetical protein PBQ24_004044 [Escherichia coli]|nr:hypothetical protein [Escherichia coli]